ncbi:MAG TPA: BON domain-containing protein [Gemmatimonadaceae bacterium]|nr:BON domain-containing protein [Gemmatimonadaceae bacterium]
MARYRIREHEDSIGSTIAGLFVGALAGFAVGVITAQKVGGIAGLASRVRERVRGVRDEILRPDLYEDEFDEYEDEDDAEYAAIERNVLEAFRNDPILSERAIDISATSSEIVELGGWVHSDDEAEHAVTIARGIPGIVTVVNRIAVGEEEARLADAARRRAEGDPTLTDSRWEGQRVGTGRRRQGTSDEPDRHSDPKPKLESRWLEEQEAIRNAADDFATGERRRTTRKAETVRGVPKGDHVSGEEARS